MKRNAESLPPENLRCKRTDGRQWRCKRRVMDDKKYCEIHYHKIFSRNKQQQQQKIQVVVSVSPPDPPELTSRQIPGGKLKKRRLIEEKQQKMVKVVKKEESSVAAVPDYLRCNRSDGRNWRCKRRVVDNMKLCEIHQLRGRKDFKIRSKNPEFVKTRSKNKKMKKKKQCMAISEALDEALKKMKLKKGDLHLELIRMFLRRQIERRKERDSEANCKGDLMKVLPNGLMAISPSSPFGVGDNVGPFCEVKIGIDSGCVTRRCFRSKNIEPLPIGPLKEVPFAKNLVNVQRVKRNNCHLCFKRGYRSMIKGSSCQKHYFCEDCLEARCLNAQKEVKEACPVCRGTCSCEACFTISVGLQPVSL